MPGNHTLLVPGTWKKSLNVSAGPGSNNIHPDAVELNGTLNHLTSAGLEELRARFVEVRFIMQPCLLDPHIAS